jgi:aminoglycoside phosphotransferase (APT) family kinase protein
LCGQSATISDVTEQLTDPLVDADRLTAFVGDRLPGSGPLTVTRLAAGHSNLTFVVRRAAAGKAWILRRPPRGPLLPTAHDVIREHRVLDLLARAGTPVRVPTVVLACEDPEVLGAPFYLMEQVPGTVIRTELPAFVGEDDRHQLGLELIDALAELHAVPTEPFVAAGIGRPEGYLARQLKRWRGQFEGALAAKAGLDRPVRPLPDYEVVSEWLGAHVPTSGAPAVVHGDYKLDNVVVAPTDQGPRIAAILDWEMATVGDPLADLGYLLSLWIEPGEDPGFLRVGGAVSALPGFATRDELVERYQARTGRSMTDVTFYVTLAGWKLAILLEASYVRHLAGTTDDPFFAHLEQGVPDLLARARSTCGA